MISIYLLLIPVIATTAWALYTKYRQRKFADLFILSLTSLAVFVNAALVYQMIASECVTLLHILQMAAASFIVPLCYTYFARQVGKQALNTTAVTLLWVLVAFTFVPQVILYNPFEPFSLPQGNLEPFTIFVVSRGIKLFSIRTGDLAVVLQCLVTILRIIPFLLLLRKHNLHLNNKVYSFGTCWMLIIAFIIMVSGMSHEELCSSFGSFFYFFFHGLLLIFTATLIAKGYDLYPIETETHETVEDINVYVQQQYGVMAGKLRNIIEEKQLYKEPLISAESVIEQLNTNHTYFSKMMSSVWGVSFSEYINNLRLSHAERLLSDDSLTISIIATQSGFTDAGYMTRKFKAKYGLTPSEWRKQH